MVEMTKHKSWRAGSLDIDIQSLAGVEGSRKRREDGFQIREHY
jgi:hypothetical protein